jgi:exodeoxyribonuclease V alpha subunit
MRQFEIDLFDHYFADRMISISNQADRGLIYYTICLLCCCIHQGKTLLSFESYENESIEFLFKNKSTIYQFPETEKWLKKIESSPLVGTTDNKLPLILSNGNLYLFRYWHYESFVIEKIKKLIQFAEKNSAQSTQIVWFDDATNQIVKKAVSNRFTMITGGPGTGKTSIAIKLMATMFYFDPNLKIELAAPTGKAAVRLNDSIKNGKVHIESLFNRHILGKIPEKASTIHRLLGSRAQNTSFKYNHDNQLDIDCMIVDESSMIDLKLMYHLLQALPEQCQLILLGDKNQLSPIEAGSVFNELCQSELTNIQTVTLALEKNYRFSTSDDIAKLSKAILAGKSTECFEILENRDQKTVTLTNLPEVNSLKSAILNNIIPELTHLFENPNIEKSLSSLKKFQVLCAMKKGKYGVNNINKLIEDTVITYFFKGKTNDNNYDGKPILILENDYVNQLFNGDIGIYKKDKTTDNFKVYFNTEKGIKSFSPARIPKHQLAYAMTIHKSQGSEFAKVLTILPNTFFEMINNQLIYTALTRASQSLEIWSSTTILEKAILNTGN